MSCLLFKLQFETPVHFGPPDSALSLYASEETFCADTLFSALCHTALSLHGPEGVETLCRWVQERKLLLSDAMPWADDLLYLPKPCAAARQAQEVDARIRKLVKKTRWVPVRAFDAFAASLAGGEPYDPTKYPAAFGHHFEVTRAAVQPEEDALPYSVGAFVFDAECGLYVLAQCEEEAEQELRFLMEGLGKSGIGGKVSSGYGRFSAVCETLDEQTPDPQLRWLYQAMNREAEQYLLLTTSLPADDELDNALEGAGFQVVRRGGFVQPGGYAEAATKKRTQYFLASGAVLHCRFAGDLYMVGQGSGHPVYRYSRPILLGVTL